MTGEAAMNLPRRQFLQIAAGAATLPLSLPRARAEEQDASPSQTQKSLARRLGDYASALRYEDLDDATIESVKVHLIDSIGCALAAFDEKPVRICRDVAFANGRGAATVI